MTPSTIGENELHDMAMKIAVSMEIHAVLSTTTSAKADAIVPYLAELLDRRKDGLGTVSVKPLEWHEVTSPREDGPAEPTGDWEAESIAGKYFIQLWEDHYEVNDPDGDYVENWLGGLEEAFAAAQSNLETRVKSCLTSIGVEAGK